VAIPPDSDQSRSQELATRRAAEQEMLLREVDEAVRQDRVGTVAKQYGWWIGGGIVAVLLLFGGYLIWQDQRESRLETDSETLVTTLDKLEAGQVEQANDALAALGESGNSGTALSAQLARAGVALQGNRRAEAVAIFDAIAANGDAPQPYRDLAAIRSVAAQFEQLDPQKVVDRLKPLAVPGNPWFGSAGELVGMAYLRQGKNDLAGPLFAAVAKDESVPASLRSRTRQLAGLLGYDAVVDVDAALAEMRNDEQAPAAPAAAE
jgi:hypothetical protein